MATQDTNNSDRPHGVTHGFSRSHNEGWSVTASDYMTGAPDHTCTGQCAHIHLSAQLRQLEQRVQQLSLTLPVKDFLWFRDSIAAIFTTIWEGKTHAPNNGHS